MDSTGELEGKVDHSFFDSDCEANGEDDGQLNKKEAQKTDERKDQESHVLKDQIKTEFQGHEKDKERLEAGLQNSEEKHHDCDVMKAGQSRDVPLRRSSPILKAKGTNNSQSDERSSVKTNSSDEELDAEGGAVFKPCSGDADTEDDDGYHQSDDESEEEDGLQDRRSSKQRGISQKKSAKLRNLSRSRSSSSGPDSSHSSEEGSSTHSRKSPVKHHRIGPASQREAPSESTDSEDTVTDVTPLSTPDVSPAQSIDMVLFSGPVSTDAQKHQPSFSEETVVDQEGSDDQRSVSSEVLLQVEKQLDRVLVSSAGSVGTSRKNYSFTNEEVRRIDQENQRLLRELSRSSGRLRSSGSAASSTCGRRSSAAPPRLYHSAINRQKEMQRIQKENLAFLKRLESVKATTGLTKDEQLAGYQRQCQYIGTHGSAAPTHKPKTGKTSGMSSIPRDGPLKSTPDRVKLSRATPRPACT